MNATDQQRGRSRHHPDIALDVMALAVSLDGLRTLAGALGGW